MDEYEEAQRWKHYKRVCDGIKMDPYRVLAIYSNVNRPPARHMVKKLLRFTDKGHTERELIQELRGCLNRWEEMLREETMTESGPDLPAVDPERFM